MKRILDFFLNTTIYKIVCICAFMLVPSYVLCYFPQAVSVVLLLWGAVILLKDLFTNRNFLKQTGSILLILFCLGYILTLIFYAENDLISTFNVYFWAIVEFFLLFAIERQKNYTVETLAEEMRKINITVSWVALLSGVASLVVFLTKTSVIMPDPEGLNSFWSMGIINGRNSGIFNNAIPCGNAMFVGCAAALYNLVMKKKRKVAGTIFYGLTFLVCLLVIMTTLTRTFVYGIYVLIFAAGFYSAYQHWMKPGKVIKALALACLVAVLVTGLTAGVAEAGKKAMVKAVENVPMNNIILNMDGFKNPSATKPAETKPVENKSDETKPAETQSAETQSAETKPAETKPAETQPAETKPVETKPVETKPVETQPVETKPVATEPSTTDPSSPEEDRMQHLKDYLSHRFGLDTDVNLDREELERLPNFFYPRDEIWKSALHVIPHSPILGFTSGNRESSSVAFGDTEYRINNWPNGIPTYHNAYFDIAVSAGLLGLGLMLAFLALQIIRTFRVLFSKRLDVTHSSTRFAVGTIVGYLATHVLISCMFLGVLCFTNVSVCIYFWVVLGYVSRINDLALQDANKSTLATRFVKRIIRK